MRRVGRIGAIALALALVLALLPAHAMAATTWDVATAVDLGNALASAADGDTIRLTDDIYYNSSITLNGISLTLDVGSHTLDVSTPGMALYVTAGAVLELESDGGAFNVTGSIGVLAEGGSAEVTSATTTSADGIGVYGAYAYDGGSITAGSVTATGSNSYGAYAWGTGSEVTVSGDVEGGYAGAYATDGGSITAGSVTATGADSIGAYADGGTVKVNGPVTGATYICIGLATKTAADGIPGTGDDLGYLKYTDTNWGGTVLVKMVVTGLPDTYSMFTGDSITWDPLPEGGEWGFDPEYFSASFNGSATFTALKAGTSDITYTLGTVSHNITVTILQAELPVTGQDDTWIRVLMSLAVAVLAAGMAVVMREKAHKAVK